MSSKFLGSVRIASVGVALALWLSGCAGTNLLNLPAMQNSETTTAEAKTEGTERAKDGTEKASAQDTAVRAKDGKSAPAAAVAGAPTQGTTASTSSADPKEVRAALAEARKLKATGKAKEALAALDKAAKAHPDHRGVAVERGLTALELGQATDAQQHLSKASATEAKDWRTLSGLGIAHASQGQQAEAQRYFRKALEIEPNNAILLNNLAMSLILDRKIDDAEALLRKASAGTDAKPMVARNLALAQSLKAQLERQAASEAAGAQAPISMQ